MANKNGINKVDLIELASALNKRIKQKNAVVYLIKNIRFLNKGLIK